MNTVTVIASEMAIGGLGAMGTWGILTGGFFTGSYQIILALFLLFCLLKFERGKP